MGIGIKELLIILAIALLVFGAGKLKNIGSDLGAAVRGFKKGISDEEETTKDTKDAKAIAPADDSKQA
jgi:sec-independent protein translocase protein TatA